MAKQGLKVKATRKRRKPMSADQKAAAAERLKKAREKRAKNNPPEYKSVHDSVLALDDDATLSMANVKEWIKTNKLKLSSIKAQIRAKTKGAESEYESIRMYIRNMENYLRNGEWLDDFYGEHHDNKMSRVCTSYAYNADGTRKRTVGVVYPDIGGVWTQEMQDQAI